MVTIITIIMKSEYAIYLRPIFQTPSAATLKWNKHSGPVEWGGFHVTMCGFRPRTSSGDKRAHPSSLRNTLQLMKNVDNNQGGWTLCSNATLEPYQHGNYTGLLIAHKSNNTQSQTLTDMCRVVSEQYLHGARSVNSLHMTISFGEVPSMSDIKAIQSDLRQCKWELVIAKKHKGIVTINQRVNLN